MSHKHTLYMQQQLGRVMYIPPIEMNKRIAEELDSLKRLYQRQPSYLNQYDQLFRLVIIWLLVHEYDLTNHQPHQVLKAVCMLNCPNWDFDLMIQQRHLLKKGVVLSAEPACFVVLQHGLNFFQAYLQAYDSLPKVNLQAEYQTRN